MWITPKIRYKLISYKTADTKSEFEAGKKLFEEYAGSLNVDLSFQNFTQELDNIELEYSKPDGALLLAYCDSLPMACAGIRRFDHSIAELKRMYVKTEYRGKLIGLIILQQAISIAKQLGYQKLRLDTLQNMAKAHQLYRSNGFYEILPYRFNPLVGTIYMEKDLRAD